MGPRITKLLDEKVRAGLLKQSLDPSIIDEAPNGVISINDLERLVQVISAAGIFATVAGKVLDTEKRTWIWHGYLNDCAIERQIALRPTLFENEYETMFDKHLKRNRSVGAIALE